MASTEDLLCEMDELHQSILSLCSDEGNDTTTVNTTIETETDDTVLDGHFVTVDRACVTGLSKLDADTMKVDSSGDLKADTFSRTVKSVNFYDDTKKIESVIAADEVDSIKSKSGSHTCTALREVNIHDSNNNNHDPNSSKDTKCDNEDFARAAVMSVLHHGKSSVLQADLDGLSVSTPKHLILSKDPKFFKSNITLSPIVEDQMKENIKAENACGTEIIKTPQFFPKKMSIPDFSSLPHSTPLMDTYNVTRNSDGFCHAKKSLLNENTDTQPKKLEEIFEDKVDSAKNELEHDDVLGKLEEPDPEQTYEELLSELTLLCEEGIKKGESMKVPIEPIKSDQTISKINLDELFRPKTPEDRPEDIDEEEENSLLGLSGPGRFTNVMPSRSTLFVEEEDVEVSEDILGLDDDLLDSEEENSEESGASSTEGNKTAFLAAEYRALSQKGKNDLEKTLTQEVKSTSGQSPCSNFNNNLMKTSFTSIKPHSEKSLPICSSPESGKSSPFTTLSETGDLDSMPGVNAESLDKIGSFSEIIHNSSKRKRTMSDVKATEKKIIKIDESPKTVYHFNSAGLSPSKVSDINFQVEHALTCPTASSVSLSQSVQKQLESETSEVDSDIEMKQGVILISSSDDDLDLTVADREAKTIEKIVQSGNQADVLKDKLATGVIKQFTDSENQMNKDEARTSVTVEMKTFDVEPVEKVSPKKKSTSASPEEKSFAVNVHVMMGPAVEETEVNKSPEGGKVAEKKTEEIVMDKTKTEDKKVEAETKPQGQAKPVIDYSEDRKIFEIENDLTREVCRRWKTKGIPTPDTNLTTPLYFRRVQNGNGNKEAVIKSCLEGDWITTIDIGKSENTTRSPLGASARSSASREVICSSLEEDLEKLYMNRMNSLNNLHTELRDKKVALQQKHMCQKQQLQMQQHSELHELKLSGYHPIILQNQLMVLYSEHNLQKNHFHNRILEEMKSLSLEYQTFIEEEDKNHSKLINQTEAILEQLRTQNITSASSKYGPHINVEVWKAPCKSNNRKKSLMTVCLPADVAHLIVKEDEVFDHFYKY